MAAHTISTGIETCASAGTKVQFETSDMFVREIVITANSANTGIIVIGDVNVVASAATRRGHPLNPDGVVVFKGHGHSDHGGRGDDAQFRFNLKDFYIDSVVSGEEVSWFAIV